MDLRAGRVRVRRALQRVEGVPIFVEPKSERSRRTVPVPGFACDALVAHRPDRARQREQAGSRWRGDDDLVSCTALGMPLHANTISHQFLRILKQAGIRPRRFHDLRH